MHLLPAGRNVEKKNGDILDSAGGPWHRHSLSSVQLGRGADFSTDAVAILADDRDVNLISAPVFTLSMNLPINIGEEIRSTLPKKRSGDIWRNAATMREVESVCETWKIRGRVAAPWLHPVTRPLLKSRPLGGSRATTPLFQNTASLGIGVFQQLHRRIAGWVGSLSTG